MCALGGRESTGLPPPCFPVWFHSSLHGWWARQLAAPHHHHHSIEESQDMQCTKIFILPQLIQKSKKINNLGACLQLPLLNKIINHRFVMCLKSDMSRTRTDAPAGEKTKQSSPKFPNFFFTPCTHFLRHFDQRGISNHQMHPHHLCLLSTGHR